MIYFLSGAFFLTAALYASVGFGGGSTYNALLILAGTDFQIVPVIALACNILVVTGNTVRYAKTGNLDWRGLLPALSLSVPMAWVGGRIPVSEFVFSAVLGIVLLLTSVSLILQAAPQPLKANGPSRTALILVPTGAACGFLAGLVGIGGGIFLAPVLYWIRWSHEKAIAAACSLFILLNSASGIAGQASKLGDMGMLERTYSFLPLLGAVFVGGWIGNRLGVFHMHAEHLRRVTALVILIVAVRLLYKVWEMQL